MTPTEDLQPEPGIEVADLHRDDTVSPDVQQNSTFLDLPIETRLNIYSYLVGPPRPFTPAPIPNIEQGCRILPIWARELIFSFFIEFAEARETARRTRESLLHVCRPVREEVAPIYYLALWEHKFSTDSINVLANPKIKTLTSTYFGGPGRQQKVACAAEDFERIYLSSLPVYKLTSIRKISWDIRVGHRHSNELEEFFRVIGSNRTKLESLNMVEVRVEPKFLHGPRYTMDHCEFFSAAAHWSKADELRPMESFVDTLRGDGCHSYESYFAALRGWALSKKVTVVCFRGLEDCEIFQHHEWRISVVKPDPSAKELTGVSKYELQTIDWYRPGKRRRGV